MRPHILQRPLFRPVPLAVAAAKTDLSKVNIDLVGLAHTGIEYAW